LPEWEAIEAKVTAEHVVETVRADVDRWRAAVLVAVGGAHMGRNQPSLAIPYLERVGGSHPNYERAAKTLVAAYLETCQTERARQLLESRRMKQ